MSLLYQIRGWRNNNPGNIERGPSKWLGLSVVQDDKRFHTFISPEYGIRCCAYILRKYQTKDALNTPFKMISKYAPSSENDVEAYCDHIHKLSGFDPNTEIDIVGNKDNLFEFVKAVITHECGINPYSDEVIEHGIALI